MILILCCVGLLSSTVITYISFQVEDDVESQLARMIGLLMLLLSFLFSPLLFKLLIVFAIAMIWPLIGDRLSLSFYRKQNR